MSNIINKIRNLLLNRNTVTILGVLAGVIALWIAYSITLDRAVKPQKVPVANKVLTAGTIITKDDIEYVEVNGEALRKASVITSSSQLIGYYVKNDTSVAIGEMFYKAQVISKDKLIEFGFKPLPNWEDALKDYLIRRRDLLI